MEIMAENNTGLSFKSSTVLELYGFGVYVYKSQGFSGKEVCFPVSL